SLTLRHPTPDATPFPYTTLFRSTNALGCGSQWNRKTWPRDNCAPRTTTPKALQPSKKSANQILPAHCCRTKRSHVVAEAFLVSRSEEHTSELQSRFDLVFRLLLA